MCKISVIVPVYKVEQYIRRCVDSILAQTYMDFELILIDDGSPDNCGAICEEYAEKDSRVRVIHRENGGLSVARNTGIEWVLSNSNSEWITFVDSDDWVHKKYLESLLRAAAEYKVQVSMCWAVKTDGEEQEPENFDACLRSTEDAYTYNGKFIASFAWGRLYQKELFFNYRFPEGKLWEDMYVIHKILFQMPEIAVVEQPLYYYYRNPQSIIRCAWSEKNMDIIYAYERELFSFFKNKYPAIYKIARRGYYLAIAENIIKAERAGCRKEARKLKHKLQIRLIGYHKDLNFTINENSWVYELAFPMFMKIYWIIKAIMKKIIKRIHERNRI